MKTIATLIVGIPALTLILVWPFLILAYVLAAVQYPEMAPVAAQWALIPASLYWAIVIMGVAKAIHRNMKETQ